LLHPQILSLEAVPFKGGRSVRRVRLGFMASFVYDAMAA
jgi:hypothetical protein